MPWVHLTPDGSLKKKRSQDITQATSGMTELNLILEKQYNQLLYINEDGQVNSSPSNYADSRDGLA